MFFLKHAILELFKWRKMEQKKPWSPNRTCILKLFKYILHQFLLHFYFSVYTPHIFYSFNFTSHLCLPPIGDSFNFDVLFPLHAQSRSIVAIQLAQFIFHVGTIACLQSICVQINCSFSSTSILWSFSHNDTHLNGTPSGIWNNQTPSDIRGSWQCLGN